MIRKSLLLILILTMATSTFVVSATTPGGGSPTQQKNPGKKFTAVQTQALESYGKDVSIDLDNQDVPSYLMGPLSIRSQSDPVAEANAALDAHGNAFRRGPDDRFTSRVIEKDQLGMTHVRMAQTYKGLSVVDAELIVHLTKDEVVGINGQFVPDLSLDTKPLITDEQAVAGALAFIEAKRGRVLQPAETKAPVIVVDEANTGRLAIPVHVTYVDSEGLEIEDIFVDAENGSVLKRHTFVWSLKNRKIYDGKQECEFSSLPGELMFEEGGTSSDTAALCAYQGTGITYDFYKEFFNRDSYDGLGSDLISTVHFQPFCTVNNAKWVFEDNRNQMIYGDGDGILFGSLATALDVVAHELTHGVTLATAGLDFYMTEAGALNEATSDILGESTAFAAGQGDWKLGAEVYTPGKEGDALRYMYDPALDRRMPPDCTDPNCVSVDYYPDLKPSTDVHYSSGIGNLFFYLLSQGGTHPREKTKVVVPAIGIEKAQAIWYRALTVYMTATTDFQGARKATAWAASDLFGTPCGRMCHNICVYEYIATQTAWDAVGVPGSWSCGVRNQLLLNQDFEKGPGSTRFPGPWRGTRNVITDSAVQPSHNGVWKAWLDGYGVTHGDTLAQTITIPSNATTAALTFWLHIDSAEPDIDAIDRLIVQIRNPPDPNFEGVVLETIATYSNLNHADGYVLRSFDLTRFKGKTIQIYFLGKENETSQTSFVIDDTAVNVWLPPSPSPSP